MTLEEAVREHQEDRCEVTHVVEPVCGASCAACTDSKIDHLVTRA
ncbi:hypothetical protein V1227_14550 [Lentzea sp. DG1S-22]|nr:hypothetical protein [Lentzea sp. DG1S-22]WVH83917.1 hypothetical protein V1227_14550 [Lentzea sp. DG1S-22]